MLYYMVSIDCENRQGKTVKEKIYEKVIGSGSIDVVIWWRSDPLCDYFYFVKGMLI